MVSFDGYSNDELKAAAKKLKEIMKPADFPVLEQIERTARKRGLDPSSEEFGEDVIGNAIKVMRKVHKRNLKGGKK
jgi:hypothetical protein